MKAKFKVNDEFRLKKDEGFTRSFRLGGFNKDGTVSDIDKEHRRGGSTARVYEVHETTTADRVEPLYFVDFGDDLKVHLEETKLLEMFEPI